MLFRSLMDGRALTATELATAAGITPQTASGHLARLTAAGILAVQKQGKHRYHRLASGSVAQMLESIMLVATELETPRKRLVVGPRDEALRKARTCYDHFAGRLGVALAESMVARDFVELTVDAGLLTDSGLAFLDRIGLATAPLIERRTRRSGRILCRPCLDWSERRTHLAGASGAAICSHAFEHAWTRRLPGTRAVALTPKGTRLFREAFAVEVA